MCQAIFVMISGKYDVAIKIVSCFLLKFESHPFIKGLLEKNEISLNGLMDYAGYDKIRYVEVI